MSVDVGLVSCLSLIQRHMKGIARELFDLHFGLFSFLRLVHYNCFVSIWYKSRLSFASVSVSSQSYQFILETFRHPRVVCVWHTRRVHKKDGYSETYKGHNKITSNCTRGILPGCRYRHRCTYRILKSFSTFRSRESTSKAPPLL